MKVISLFCGVGGMDLGFIQAGHKVIWANDNNAEAVQTYQKNIGKHAFCDNIENININLIPKADIVIGGFPCQGFSIANMNRRLTDKRNFLYRYFVRVISQKNPRLFIAENVRGLLSLDNGRVFEQIVRDFSAAGYNCRHAILNAANYGVPQSRLRVFILGIRKDLNIDIDFPPKITHSEKPFGNLKKFISVGNALSSLPEPEQKHRLKNHVFSKFKVKYNGYISNRKLDPNKPSPTVTARGDMRGGAMIMPHPFKNRRMSCRELAIIQGFPMGFEFCGKMTSIYRQIGNAVPPPLAKAIANSVENAEIRRKKVETQETAVQLSFA